MSVRAILIGLACAAGVCGFTFFNDFILRQTFLVGNYMPISVYGGLLLFLLFVNPLLLRRVRLNNGELAVIIALTLAASYMPGRGLMHYFGTFLMLPNHYARTMPGWKEAGVLDLAPKRMLADVSQNESESLNGFIQGMSEGTHHMAFSRIPWYAWTRTLAFWLPLLVSFSVAMIALALVVHRQWSSHEQMPYPIVSFANALLPNEGEARGWVFQNRLFWIACIAVLCVHLDNYACEWWPRYLIRVERTFDFRSLVEFIPPLQRAGNDYLWNLMNPTVYFTVIGFAFFLSTDVSFSLGIAGYAYAYLVGVLAGYGIALGGGGFISLKIETFLFGGAYLGMFLMLLYTGRHYYLNVFRKSVWLPSHEEVEREAVWGARALGPKSMLIMFMVTSLLLIDPREAVMPFMVQAFKLTDSNKAALGKVAKWSVVALLLGFAVAVPVTLYWHYDQGMGRTTDGWTANVPKMAFDATVSGMERLKAQGVLEEAGKFSGLDWFRNLQPNGPCVLAFFIAMGLVLLFGAARLRFPRWPFHPLMFLVLATWQSRCFAFSFLIGCVVKVAVTKYGGASAYQKVKPLMIGLIAGDMLGGVTPMIIGLIYYLLTGEPPKRFLVFPS